MPYVVMEIQATPNPNALKFILDRPMASQPISFLNPAAAAAHPIAAELFAIAGVTSILMLGDFLTVNKQPAARWSTIRPKVKAVLKRL